MNNIEDQQKSIAEEMYQRYDFGSDVTVVAKNGWEYDGSGDFISIVFVEFDDSNGVSSRISFHVTFAENSLEPQEVYGLLTDNGDIIGNLPRPKMKM